MFPLKTWALIHLPSGALHLGLVDCLQLYSSMCEIQFGLNLFLCWYLLKKRWFYDIYFPKNSSLLSGWVFFRMSNCKSRRFILFLFLNLRYWKYLHMNFGNLKLSVTWIILFQNQWKTTQSTSVKNAPRLTLATHWF